MTNQYKSCLYRKDGRGVVHIIENVGGYIQALEETITRLDTELKEEKRKRGSKTA